MGLGIPGWQGKQFMCIFKTSSTRCNIPNDLLESISPWAFKMEREYLGWHWSFWAHVLGAHWSPVFMVEGMHHLCNHPLTCQTSPTPSLTESAAPKYALSNLGPADLEWKISKTMIFSFVLVCKIWVVWWASLYLLLVHLKIFVLEILIGNS